VTVSTITPPPPQRRWLRISAWLGASLVAIAAVVVGVVLIQAPTGSTQTTATSPSPSTTVQPSPSPSPTVPPAPPKATQVELAGVPVAFYDAVICPLLDSSKIVPVNQWKLAVPVDPLVALYATPTPDATPIAALGSTVPTVRTPTVVAVCGVSGDMILVSTPSRNAAPGPNGPTPSGTFAWARTADLTVSAAPHSVMVDNANSTISIVSASGEVSTSETARLGTPNDPTPAATATYIESIYVDKTLAYTRGNPIALTGAHSSTLIEYGGNSALTAIHYYPSTVGLSHGCVRVSAEMTKALAALPIGTPVIFS
jgi:hypothetical protein